MKVVNKRTETPVPVMQSNTAVLYYGGLVYFVLTTQLLFSTSGYQYLTRLLKWALYTACVQYVYLHESSCKISSCTHIMGTHLPFGNNKLVPLKVTHSVLGLNNDNNNDNPLDFHDIKPHF